MGQIDFKTMRVSTGIQILILGLMFAFSTNQFLSDTPRIINGTAAQVGQFPYVICVKRPLGRCCTGSLITAEKVITACHCFKPNEENCEINCDSSKRVETDLAWFECTVKEIISDKLIKTYSPSQSVFKGDSGSPLVDNFENPKIHGVLYGHGSTGAVYGLITSAKKWIIKNSESDPSEKQRYIRSNGSPMDIISIWVFFMPSVIHCGKQIRI